LYAIERLSNFAETRSSPLYLNLLNPKTSFIVANACSTRERVFEYILLAAVFGGCRSGVGPPFFPRFLLYIILILQLGIFSRNAARAGA